jgi:hypothetical protein
MHPCQTDSDCRVNDGYSCQDPTYLGINVCYPNGGTNDGNACVTPPSPLPSAGFSANLMSPNGGANDTGDAEGNVAADGLGHELLTFIEIDNNGGLEEGVAAYTDPSIGGTGFASTSQVFSTALGSGGSTSDPTVIFDRQAVPPRAFMAYMDIAANNGVNIMVSHSDSNGAPGTWSTPQVVSGPNAGNYDKPWITARNGTVIVTFGNLNKGHIDVVRSSNDGNTWGTVIDADNNTNYKNLATPVLDMAGNLWVTWFEQGAVTDEIRVSEQPAGASAFSASVHASGTIVPGFDDPVIDVTPDGTTMWLSFSDHDAGTGSDVWASVSHDGGKTFSTPVRVNDDAQNPKAPLPCATHYQANLAVDAQGRAHIAWDDNRWGPNNGAVVYTYSTSDTTFAPNGVISDTPFPFSINRGGAFWLGDYLGIAVDATKVYAAWTDPRNQTTTWMYFADKTLEP